MQCLNCGTEMLTNLVSIAKGTISYNMCEKCGSLWLDAGELNRMAFQVQGNIEYCSQEPLAEPESHIRKCPRCDNSDLDRVRFLDCTDIILHRCGNCGGFWLDGGQLDIVDKELTEIMPVRGHGFSDFVNNVHVPYWYKRVQRKSNETDVRVEAEPIKGATLVRATAHPCPACEHALSEYSVFRLRFEGCPSCKGIWLFQDELRILKNKVDHGYTRWLDDEIRNIEKTSAIETQRVCPQCKPRRLVSALFGHSQIVVDWCPECHGMWLDRGEFNAIAESLKRELIHQGPQEIETKALEEIKRLWTGGDESRTDDLLDLKSTLSALINVTVFEHPALMKLCSGAARMSAAGL